MSRDSSVGIGTRLPAGRLVSRVQFLAGAGNFSLHHRVRNGSGAHPASYPMGIRGFSLAVKRPGREADHSPPSSAKVKECVELHLHSPNTPSWRRALLRKKYRDNFTFTLFNTLNELQIHRQTDRQTDSFWNMETDSVTRSNSAASRITTATIKTCSPYEVYPKLSGLAAWTENCKWYSCVPLGALVSLFCESV
jgi:hypothetical protein